MITPDSYLRTMAKYPLPTNASGVLRHYVREEWTKMLEAFAQENIDADLIRGNSAGYLEHVKWISQQWNFMDPTQQSRSAIYAFLVLAIVGDRERMVGPTNLFNAVSLYTWFDEHALQIIDAATPTLSFAMFARYMGKYCALVGPDRIQYLHQSWVNAHPLNANDHACPDWLESAMEFPTTSGYKVPSDTTLLMYFRYIAPQLMQQGMSEYVLDLNRIILQKGLTEKYIDAVASTWPLTRPDDTIDWDAFPVSWLPEVEKKGRSRKNTDDPVPPFIRHLFATYITTTAPYHTINWKPLEGFVQRLQPYSVDQLLDQGYMGVYLYARMQVEEDWHIHSPELIALADRYLERELAIPGKVQSFSTENMGLVQSVWLYFPEDIRQKHLSTIVQGLSSLKEGVGPGIRRIPELYLPYLFERKPKLYNRQDIDYVLQLWNRHTQGETLDTLERQLLTRFSTHIFSQRGEGALSNFCARMNSTPSVIDMLSAWKQPWSKWIYDEVFPHALAQIAQFGLTEDLALGIERMMDSLNIELGNDHEGSLMDRYNACLNDPGSEQFSHMDVFFQALRNGAFMTNMRLMRSFLPTDDSASYYHQLSKTCLDTLRTKTVSNDVALDAELVLFQE